jgi:hypothetical protein
MRKINLDVSIDPSNFELKGNLKIRFEDGTKESVEIPRLEDFYDGYNAQGYTEEEQKKVDAVNELLEINGQEKMTKEESDFMLGKFFKPENTIDDLTKLAGYEVVKEIRPFRKQTTSGVADVTDRTDLKAAIDHWFYNVVPEEDRELAAKYGPDYEKHKS